MLSHHDRRLLRNLEQRLADDDPAFVSRMRVPAVRPRFPIAPTMCVAAVAASPAAMLLGGWTAVITMLGGAALASGVVALGRRRP